MFTVFLMRPPAAAMKFAPLPSVREARARARETRAVARGWPGAVVSIVDAAGRERASWTNRQGTWVAAPHSARNRRPPSSAPGPAPAAAARTPLPRGVRLRVALPTVSEANTADHAHWTHRHRRARTQIQAMIELLATCDPAERALPLRVTFGRVGPALLDREDNLPVAFKHLRDGVAQALGLPDDRDPRVTWRYRQTRDRAAWIEIDLERREEGPAADHELLEDARDLVARVEALVASDDLPPDAAAHGRALLGTLRARRAED